MKLKRKDDFLFLEYTKFNFLIEKQDQIKKILPWKFTNYNFWNNETNIQIPNRNILDTRFTYYPFEIFSYSLGLEKKILKAGEKIIKEKLEINDAINKMRNEKNDLLNKNKELHEKGPLFMFYCMICKYDKNVDYDDIYFQKYINEIVKSLKNKWKKMD